MEYIYAALLLYKTGKEINEENLKKVIAATGIEVDSKEEVKIKSLVASLKGVDIDKELEGASLVTAARVAEEKAPEKKKEEKPKEEAAAEGLSALFG